MSILKNRSGIITYTIDKNIKNDLYISVQNGEVVVKAPWYFSRNQIQKVVEEKKKWIVTKIKEYEERNGRNRKEETSNTRSIKIYGEDFFVDVCYKDREKLSVNPKGDNRLKVELPYKYKRVPKKEMMDVLVEKIYKVATKQLMEQTMEKIRILVGFAPENYTVEYMDHILGKCTQDKTIVINPEIIKYRPEIIDYVVLHQFCHLKYKTHSKGFYEMLKKYEPHCEEYGAKISGWQY